jgi:predicted permease
MPVLAQILAVVFPVFAIIGVGYIFASFKKMSLEPIIDVLLYLTIPALVISSLSKKQLVIDDLFTVAVAACFVVCATGILSLIYLSIKKRRDSRGFYLPTMFMNSGNMAFPLSLLAFGPEGLAVAVLFYIVIGVLVYSVGIYIAKGEGGLREIFRLPLIYAAAIGIGLNLGGVKMPGPIFTTFDMLGAATIPLMQVSLGYRLYSVKFKLSGAALSGSIIRIGGGFLAAYLITTLLGIDGLNRKIIILSSTMPSAVINFVVSHKYDLDSDLVASVIATSTLLSVISTPIVLFYIIYVT